MLASRPEVQVSDLLCSVYATYPVAQVADRLFSIMTNREHEPVGARRVAVRTLASLCERDGCNDLLIELNRATKGLLNEAVDSGLVQAPTTPAMPGDRREGRVTSTR